MAKPTKTAAPVSAPKEDAKVAQYEEKVTETLKPYAKKVFHFLAYLCFLASLVTAMVPDSMRDNKLVASVMGWLHVAALNVNHAAPADADACDDVPTSDGV